MAVTAKSAVVILFLLVEQLPLWEVGPLNLQDPELWGQEAQMLPGVMVRVRPLLFSSLGSWTRVSYLLEAKHWVTVGDLEYMLHPGEWYPILAEYCF